MSAPTTTPAPVEAGGPTSAAGPVRGGRTRGRARRARGWRRVVLGLVLVVALSAAWLVGFSSVLTTRDVAVSGQRILTAEAIKETAAVPLGTPLARQDTTAVADRVAALPPVESVRVERRWPHTVAVLVVERTPLLAVPAAEGVVLVDRAGVGFATVATPPAGVPRAEVDLSDPAAVSAAATVAGGLTPELARRVSRVEARSADAIDLVVDGKIRVQWGTSAESPLKSAIVNALLKRKPKAIDVSAPHTPAMR